MIRLEMKGCNMILLEKLQKYPLLSSGKIDKYEYLTGKKILTSNQEQIIEHPKFTYSPLGKAFKKLKKAIKDQREKQVDALEALKPKEVTTIKYDN